jgi:hypothetical protein
LPDVGGLLSTATLLPNGAALAAGSIYTSATELYDPSTGLWSETGSMSVARFAHTATLLSDGTVLVAGGILMTPGSAGAPPPQSVLASAEIYTPPDAAAQISAVITVVNSLSLAPGTQTSLDAKLEPALAAVEAGDTTTACNQLNAFTHEVRAQTGHGLTADQANELLDEAARLEAVLGC